MPNKQPWEYDEVVSDGAAPAAPADTAAPWQQDAVVSGVDEDLQKFENYAVQQQQRRAAEKAADGSPRFTGPDMGSAPGDITSKLGAAANLAPRESNELARLYGGDQLGADRSGQLEGDIQTAGMDLEMEGRTLGVLTEKMKQSKAELQAMQNDIKTPEDAKAYNEAVKVWNERVNKYLQYQTEFNNKADKYKQDKAEYEGSYEQVQKQLMPGYQEWKQLKDQIDMDQARRELAIQLDTYEGGDLETTGEKVKAGLQGFKADAYRTAGGISQVSALYHQAVENTVQKAVAAGLPEWVVRGAITAVSPSSSALVAGKLAETEETAADGALARSKELQPVAVRRGETIQDAINRADWGKAGELLFYGVTGNAVSSLTALAASYFGTPAAGSALLGVSAGGQKYHQIKDRQDLSQFRKVANAAGSGLAEALFERFGTGEIAERIIKGAAGGARGVMKQKILARMKSILGDAWQEGWTEAATQMTENILDNVTGVGNPGLFDGVPDSFLIGLSSGGAMQVGFKAIEGAAGAVQQAGKAVKDAATPAVEPKPETTQFDAQGNPLPAGDVGIEAAATEIPDTGIEGKDLTGPITVPPEVAADREARLAEVTPEQQAAIDAQEERNAQDKTGRRQSARPTLEADISAGMQRARERGQNPLDPAIYNTIVDQVDISSRNPVTGLPSQKHKNSRLDEVMHNVKPGHVNVFTEADINFFKALNDNFSQEYGNYALRQVMGAMNAAAARRGMQHFHETGDENSVIDQIPREQLSEYIDKMAEIKDEIDQIRLVLPDGRKIPVGMSMSLSTDYTAAGENLKTSKKSLGRNAFFIDNLLKNEYNKVDKKGPDIEAAWKAAGLKIAYREDTGNGNQGPEDGNADVGVSGKTGPGPAGPDAGTRPGTAGPGREVSEKDGNPAGDTGEVDDAGLPDDGNGPAEPDAKLVERAISAVKAGLKSRYGITVAPGTIRQVKRLSKDNKETLRGLNALFGSDVTPSKVVFVDFAKNSSAAKQRTFTGAYNRQLDVYIINASATKEQALHFILGHEIVHKWDATNHKMYQRLQAALRRIDPEAYRRYKAGRERGADPGHWRKEFLGDTVGEVLSSPANLQKIAKHDAGLLEQIRKFIKTILKKITLDPAYRASRFFTQFHKVEREITGILAGYSARIRREAARPATPAQQQRQIAEWLMQQAHDQYRVNKDADLLDRIDDAGGIRLGRFYRGREEVKTIGKHVRMRAFRQKGGIPLDEMAERLHMSDTELLQALNEYEPAARPSQKWEDYLDEAKDIYEQQQSALAEKGPADTGEDNPEDWIEPSASEKIAEYQSGGEAQIKQNIIDYWGKINDIYNTVSGEVYEQLDLFKAKGKNTGAGTPEQGVSVKADPGAGRPNPEIQLAESEENSVSAIYPELVKEQYSIDLTGLTINSPVDFALAIQGLRSPYQEKIGVAILDKDKRIIRSNILFLGGADASSVYPGTVQKEIVAAGAAADSYIIFHNHPGSNPNPSSLDKNITKVLRDSITLRLRDHVIIDGDSFYSFDQDLVIPLADRKLAEWEAIPVEKLTQVSNSESFRAVIANLSAKKTGKAFILYLTSQNRITAAQAVPQEINRVQITEQLQKNANTYGATAVLIGKDNFVPGDVSFIMNKMRTLGVRLLDVSTNDVPSYADQGILSEEKADYTARPAPKTEAFKKWFGDSKVVDENGKPLVVYHGSEAEGITIFKRSKYADEDIFYFTDNESVAESYKPRFGQGEVYSVYLKMENPLIIDAEDKTYSNKDNEATDNEFDPYFDILSAADESSEYDGVIIRNFDDTAGGTGQFSDVYVVFSPTQIKSATGNVGTYDPKNPDIRFQDQRPLDRDAEQQRIQKKINELNYRIRAAEAKGDSKGNPYLNNTRLELEKLKKERTEYVKNRLNQFAKEIGLTKFANNQVADIVNNAVTFGDMRRGFRKMSSLQNKRRGQAGRGEVPTTKKRKQVDPQKGQNRSAKLNEIYQEAAKTRRIRTGLRGAYDRVLEKIWGDEKIRPKSKSKAIAQLLAPISTQIEAINPKLKYDKAFGIRGFTYNKQIGILRDTERALPFMEKFSNMPKADQNVLDLALKNADQETAVRIMKKHGMLDAFAKLRILLDDIRERALDAGYNVRYLENYYPRQVINATGFMDYLYETSDDFGQIDAAIKKQEELLGRPLSDAEAASVINSYIGRSERNVESPGNIQEREVDIIDTEMNKYYDYSVNALAKYITNMNHAIAMQKFLGNAVNAENPNLIDIDKGIGEYLGKLRQEGKIGREHQDELLGILMAHFGFRPTARAAKWFKSAGYAVTMGSGYSSFLSQLGDMAWALNESLTGAWTEFGKALLGKSKIKMEMLGVDRISAEFEKADKADKFLEKLFKATLLEKMDRVGKETLINTIRKSYQKKAKRGDAGLRQLLENVFDTEADAVMQELAAGKDTENTMYLYFNRLMDHQPAALSEMPQKYLDSPNFRIFYMLKTFTLKQMDIVRREALWGIKNAQTAKEKAAAYGKLMKLVSLFILANSGADALKDLVFGRKPTLSDYVFDNIFRLAGLSRFLTWEARRNGVGAAFSKLVTPPLNLIEYPFKDINNLVKGIADGELHGEKFTPLRYIKNLESWQNVPILGKHYHWYFGAGRARIKRREAKENKRSRRGRRRSRSRAR